MIWVLAGTRDGREIVNLLVSKGYQVLASTVTSYGERLIKEGFSKGYGAGCKLIVEAMDFRRMIQIIREERIRWLIDATHPFAREVSENARRACRETGTKYVRFERKVAAMSLDDVVACDRLIRVRSVDEAAEKAVEYGSVIFLTTGSKTLDVFVKRAFKRKKRVVARVLPDVDVIRRCLELGLVPRDIIAMQGPFSKEVNKALLKEYQASVLVTKESGRVGGTDTKIAAALELEIPVILIERPEMNYESVVDSYEELLKLIAAEES